jgi:protein-disulfide isomerase
LDAPVTIIEFASLSCPHCAVFHKERFPWLKKNFIDTGKVRFIFRDFPLNRAALLGSMVAHCADPRQYFAYLGLLFERQENWAFTEPTEQGLASLAQLAHNRRSERRKTHRLNCCRQPMTRLALFMGAAKNFGAESRYLVVI